MQNDWIDRLALVEADALAVAAPAVVVEDDGRLGAARGLAAELDARHPDLRARREQIAAEHGGTLPLGAVVPLQLGGDEQRTAVWIVTWNILRNAPPAERATPLLIEAATRRALREAIKAGAQHVALPALGTRLDQHALPPVPKKLPRYVMGTAQLIGIGHALHSYPSLRVTVCLTQRDLLIWNTLLGRGTDDEA